MDNYMFWPVLATGAPLSPQGRSRIKEKDGEQAFTQLRNHIPAEHTSKLALLLKIKRDLDTTCARAMHIARS